MLLYTYMQIKICTLHLLHDSLLLGKDEEKEENTLLLEEGGE